ncbi:hypothetical protein OLL89_14095 (plasmid) [Enterococcus faecalis]|nr:hypothetical protein OLL89_14440 [Enterococcus faecalis]UYY10738.1 hypothetical protein OLL89_14095 [Enterococcus faecalis]
MNLTFDYTKEPSRDVLCIDVKSFYASVECVERGLDPLKTMLVVMSNSENSGGLVLAASPMAKKVLGISNVTRKNEVPDHPNLIIVSPRMKLYMKKNQEINNLYKRFVSDEDHSVFSVDESFLDVTASLTYFKCDTAYKLAKIIQRVIYNHMGLYVTIRMASCQTTCVSLFVGYSKGQTDKYGQTGWRRQMKVEPSNNTKVLTEHVLRLFEENYAPGVDVRNLGVSYGRLVWNKNLQLDLFSVPEEQIHETDMYFLIDKIRQKFGFKALIHASSLMEGATAISRASLVGGHAGGTVGLGTTK